MWKARTIIEQEERLLMYIDKELERLVAFQRIYSSNKYFLRDILKVNNM